MQSVSLITYNLLKLGRKAAECTKEENLHISGVSNFPLHHRSKDLLFIAEDNQTNPNCVVYQQLLQVVSSFSKFEKFDSLTPEIVNQLDKSQGAVPLHYACMNGNLSMINLLLENGAEVDIWDREEQVTPLICAAALGRFEIVKLLLEHNCNVNAGFHNSKCGQYSALHWAVKGNHPDIVRCLLENNAYQHSSVPFSETPIHTAVIIGSQEILQMLVNAQSGNSAKTDFQMGVEKNSPLHLAASGKYDNSYELCKILIENGSANVNLVNLKGKTPLHEAALSRNPKTVELLLDHNAKINAVDNLGRTPLFYAVSIEKEALDTMKILTATGDCNVNHQDLFGNTPLHLVGNDSAAGAAEILLMNAADFSIRNDVGISALSILRKNIPTTSLLLSKAFDQAVRLTDCQNSEIKAGPDCQVDFKYVLPFNNENFLPFTSEEKVKTENSPRLPSIFNIIEEENNQVSKTKRKETSKIKCLLDEEYSSLLLHPVVHSFLELKWHKVRFFFMPTLAFKMLLMILYSAYLHIPYIFNTSNVEGRMDVEQYCYDYSYASNNGTAVIDNIINRKGKTLLLWLQWLYLIIATMSALNALMELFKILRAPKQQLRNLHPWISLSVWVMIIINRPETWERACDPCRKPLVALAILLGWVDLWADMARFPIVGHSIRVFLQVFKNFWSFIFPHSCLLIGFMLSLSLIFNDDIEFQSVALTLPKLFRLMAGDGQIPAVALNVSLTGNSTSTVIFHHISVIYIFTAFVLVVGIVLMNLLLALAVFDLNKIFESAAVDKLIKQTLLINTLERSFSGNWRMRVFGKHVNMFHGQDEFNKIIAFNPFDSSDSLNLSNDQRKALFSIGSANRGNYFSKHKLEPLSRKIHRRKAIRKLRSKIHSDEEENVLMDIIDKLKDILVQLDSKTGKS